MEAAHGLFHFSVSNDVETSDLISLNAGLRHSR
jgi:hypothetical protein